MYSILAVATILTFYVHSGLTISCPKSSSEWCQTKEIARACDVTAQCQKYVWRVHDDNDKVNFTLYYETLCPDCRQFMSSQLWKTYKTIPEIINITLVPYGNAREAYNSTSRMYDFDCQHGPNECLGNLIHTCVLYYYPTTDQHMPFVYCTESNSGDVKTVASQCATKSQIDFSKIEACTSSILGNQLQHAYAVETEGLQPAHKYVPWVTVNGKHTETMEREAERDLIKLICKTYKGSNPPAECKKRL